MHGLPLIMNILLQFERDFTSFSYKEWNAAGISKYHCEGNMERLDPGCDRRRKKIDRKTCRLE